MCRGGGLKLKGSVSVQEIRIDLVRSISRVTVMLACMLPRLFPVEQCRSSGLIVRLTAQRRRYLRANHFGRALHGSASQLRTARRRGA